MATVGPATLGLVFAAGDGLGGAPEKPMIPEGCAPGFSVLAGSAEADSGEVARRGALNGVAGGADVLAAEYTGGGKDAGGESVADAAAGAVFAELSVGHEGGTAGGLASPAPPQDGDGGN